MMRNINLNVLNYGAIADGLTLNTEAVQAAIDACASMGRKSNLYKR